MDRYLRKTDGGIPLPERLGFVARLMIAAPLPHSRPADIRFARTSGLQDLCLLAPQQIGLPYGRSPRLALAWMTTEAVRRKTRRIPLAPSFSGFARQIGITPSTGLRDQMLRLVHLSIVCPDPSASSSALPAAFRRGGVHLVERALLWWDPPCGDSGPFILFSQDFYDEIISRPVSIDLDVVRSLRSPLAIDVYLWLTYRSLRACRIGRSETIAWEALIRQLGGGDSEVRNLRFRFRKAIEDILRVCPELRLRSSPAGLVLLP